MLENIENEDSLWFSNEKTEIFLQVNSVIVEYLKRREILVSQKILE